MGGQEGGGVSARERRIGHNQFGHTSVGRVHLCVQIIPSSNSPSHPCNSCHHDVEDKNTYNSVKQTHTDLGAGGGGGRGEFA